MGRFNVNYSFQLKMQNFKKNQHTQWVTSFMNFQEAVLVQ